MGDSFYKRMFLAGALWNFLGGVVFGVCANWVFGLAKLTPPEPRAYYDSWIALFVTFGIGYLMVSRDPQGNQNIVILGIIGKLAFSAIFIYGFLFAAKGEIPPLFWAGVVGDLIFAALFWMFLRSSGGRTSQG